MSKPFEIVQGHVEAGDQEQGSVGAAGGAVLVD